MNHDFLRLSLLFILLTLAQVFILNHVQLFGIAIPMPYIFFVITMKKGMAKWAMITWAFAMGIVLDTFANTPGVTAASLTMAAMAQPYVLDLFMTREGDGDLVPSVSTIGAKPFVNYATVLTGGFCIAYFTLEMFSFLNYLRWLECVVASTLLTVALVVAIDSLKRKKD
ncbi:MAG: rod shape-determining protein MreD [Prevotella sp.]|nr:rod shape-determining protein MreD [Prevotella sp.]